MASNEITKFELYNNTYTVVESNHLFEDRHGAGYSRNHNITPEMYEDILKGAIKNGLTSFRGKKTVVTWKTKRRKGYSAILVCLNERNEIIVITAYTGYNVPQFYRLFIKEHNRINLKEKH